MTLDLIKNNLDKQNEIIGKLLEINEKIANPNYSSQEKLLLKSSDELVSQLEIINNSLPDLLNGIQFYTKLKSDNNVNSNLTSAVVKIKYTSPIDNQDEVLAIKKNEQEKYLESVSSYQGIVKKLEKSTPISAINPYIILANRLFRKTSSNLIKKGYFDSIKVDLRKITSPLLADTYVSLMFFFTAVSLVFALFFGLILLFLGVNVMVSLAFILLIPIVTFLGFFIYPSSQRKAIEKEINQELPFMTIYTAAISTSGIEPSKIFEIIIGSDDYPFIKREVKKLTNYVNFYGYDLVNALKLVSRNSPSERLGQLFDGLATTITSGGDLTVYLNKHAETLLFDYRLEREKYTHMAETFMNIYISVVIAAPMIMMVLFILMSMAGIGMTMGITTIAVLVILVVSVVNIAFLMFLNLNQPKF